MLRKFAMKMLSYFKVRLARISLSIVFIFLLCHSLKIIPRSLSLSALCQIVHVSS